MAKSKHDQQRERTANVKRNKLMAALLSGAAAVSGLLAAAVVFVADNSPETAPRDPLQSDQKGFDDVNRTPVTDIEETVVDAWEQATPGERVLGATGAAVGAFGVLALERMGHINRRRLKHEKARDIGGSYALSAIAQPVNPDLIQDVDTHLRDGLPTVRLTNRGETRIFDAQVYVAVPIRNPQNGPPAQYYTVNVGSIKPRETIIEVVTEEHADLRPTQGWIAETLVGRANPLFRSTVIGSCYVDGFGQNRYLSTQQLGTPPGVGTHGGPQKRPLHTNEPHFGL